MTIVSNNIKYLRRLNGLTQEQFSRKIGIKRSLLGAYEEARANPNLDNLQNMAKMFGTTVDSLIKTDIRKIRETPGLNYQINQPNTKANLVDYIEKPVIEPIANVFVKYFKDVPIENVQNVNTELPHLTENFQRNSFDNIVNNEDNKLNYSENNIVNTLKSIPFVNKHELTNYINRGNLNPYLNSLPQVSLPTLSITNKTRAFFANDDFPIENSIIIGEILESHLPLAEGQHHIIVCKDGRLLFRRVYDNTRHKGCYLLSSDEQDISSTEIPENQVVQILRFMAFMSTTLPKSNKINPKIKNLINELFQESTKA